MSAILLPWLKLTVCAALIGIAGPLLARYGDVIARLTGLSRSWVGLVLLGTATSLPELFTGLSSVVAAGAPNIAVGDVMGSCLINLTILIAIDAMVRKEPIYNRIDPSQILPAAFGIMLIGLAAVALLASRNGFDFPIFHVSAYTPLIIVLYLFAMRTLFVHERGRPDEPERSRPDIALNEAIKRYLFAAAIVVGAGSWLPFIGTELAEVMGWRDSFVGTLFVAGATSLPELTVTISALRLGAVNMAVGNLLGSNLIDMLVLAIDDIAYIEGSLLAAVSPAHLVSALAAMAMTGIFIGAVLYRPQGQLFGRISWVSLPLLAVYLVASYLIYLYAH